jgi:hypothetical protein
MKQKSESAMAFESFGKSNQPHTEDGLEKRWLRDNTEEMEWLMSLALDSALDTDEAARLDALLVESPENEQRWTAWQTLDKDFRQMPCVLPPLDFGEKFALRLELQERQRRLRMGVIFGLAAVALWGSALVGVASLGALAWSNQSLWLGDLIYNWAAWWAAFGKFGETLVNTAQALLSAPQTRMLIVCYVVTSMAILASWFLFLRRSTHELGASDGQMLEA